MHLIHERADADPGAASNEGDLPALATDVEVADSLLTKAVGLMGRSSVPEGYALVFEFGGAAPRSIHMVGVRTPIDVLWLVEEEVQRVETLPAWTGLGRARADTVVELAPGAAADVAAGDEVRLVDD